jgi:very-short-patch-repair endonuclease
MSQRQRWRTTAAIQQRAQDLRRGQTPAERRLWARLRGKQMGGFRFRRQHPIGPFIVGFCCLSPRLVVEIDGDSHAEQVEYDEMRTTYLEERGYAVIRFTNEDVLHRLDGVLAEITQRCEGLVPLHGSEAERD